VEEKPRVAAQPLRARPAPDVSRPAGSAPNPAAPNTDNIDLQKIWAEPAFQAAFVGAYGINAEIEPRVAPEDLALLEQVRPMMADNLPLAQETLIYGITEDSSAVLDFTLAGVYFQQDKLEDALAWYESAVIKYPSFRRAWKNLGLLRIRGGNPRDAIPAFNRMIELGGADAYSYGLLGYAHATLQDYQPAEAAYRIALLLQPESTEWRLGLTRCVFKQNKFSDAIALLDVLIAKFPSKPEFWTLQAQAFLGIKENLKAASNLECLAAMGKATAEAQQMLGDIYVNESLPDLALRAYATGLEINPNQSASKTMRNAELLASRGSVPQARELIGRLRSTSAGAISEDERRKLLKLDARLSMAAGGGGEETTTVLEEVLKLDPLDGEALLLLGQHYGRSNQQEKALLYYERAAGIGEYEVRAKIRQAQLLVQMGRYGDALPLLRRAQELKPREDIARYLEQVERLSKSRR
jgi:tetratricopeptide (TPR) repeat protein